MGNLFWAPKPSSPIWDPYPTWAYTPKGLRAELCQTLCESAGIGPGRKFRIVICASGNAGKSSSINNILAALNNKYAQVANVGGYGQQITQMYTEYKLPICNNSESSYVICDTPGLRDCLTEDQLQVQTEAIKAAIFGKFQQREEVRYLDLTVAELEAKAIRQECAVGVIFVIDIRKVYSGAIDTSHAFKTMKTILALTQRQNISISCLLTHCDNFDTNVKEDVSNMYRSPTIELQRQILERKFDGFPGNRIFPIVNYTERICVNHNMMVQSLFALNQIIKDIHLKHILTS